MAVIINGTTGITDVNGTAAAPALTGTDTDTGIFFPAANTLAFSTNGTEDARFDSAGNFGLGVTPNTWRTNDKAIQIGGSTDYSNIVGTGAGITFGNNFYRDSGGFKYKNSYAAGRFDFDYTAGGGFTWNIAPSGTAGNAITFTQAMTLDASGRLGIGQTSPNVSLHIENTSSIIKVFSSGNNAAYTNYQSNGNGKFFYVGQDNSTGASFGVGGYSSVLWNDGAYPIVFATNNAERARIDSSGRLLVGTTSAFNSAYTMSLAVSGSTGGLVIKPGADGYTAIQFFNAAGSNVGSISCSSSTTTYSTSSDYRLKENIAPMTGALATVAQLKPVTYTWKATGETTQGFIAHELAEVVPDAVVGEKDAVDAEGNPVYQGIDTSFLVATLTAALQEMKAIIDDQAARIVALEAK